MKKSGLLLIMFFLWPVCALADAFQLVKIATGLGVPWGMTFISDDKILFTERQGNLGVLSVSSGLLEYIEGLPEIHVAGQGGLMDVATSPNYNFDNWLYFTYAKPVNSYSETTLARARLIDSHLVDWQD
ncbi:MAG: PQQ-dependent sugar dehydrogenase, partial [Gammaproteobacteria bacterium]|nr:PQQ-dependent sugar dehydrogenase [Gammaproteobacteria bacterium]